MKHPLAEILRSPLFQAKMLLVILALAWIVISLLAGDSVLLYLLMTPHLLLVCLAFIPKRIIFSFLIFFVGLEIAVLVFTFLLSRWIVEKFAIVLLILLCGRTLYALIQASELLQEKEAPHGFEPVMKPQKADEPHVAIPAEDSNAKSIS